MTDSLAPRWVYLPGVVVILAAIALWQAAVGTGLLSFQYLPAPDEIASALVDLIGAGELLPALAHTVIVVLEAWVIGMIAGVAAGVALGSSKVAWRYSAASIDVLRAVPIIALVPVALLVLGVSSTAELAVAAYAAVWPILVNTAGGVQGIDPSLQELMRSLRLSRWERARKVVIPAASASVLVGARLALSLALIITVVTEMIGNPEGLGAGIVNEQMALQPARMWVYVLVTGTLGFALNWCLMGAYRMLMPGLAAQAREAS